MAPAHVRAVMTEEPASAGPRRFILFTYGFRPFFLLAGLWAVVPMIVVLGAMQASSWPADAIPVFRWHGHEMLYGFATAAIAGFLLTAVPNWTGTRAVAGWPLGTLVAAWLVARVVAAPFWQPANGLVQAASLAFFPMLALALAAPLVRGRNYRNLPFLVLLALLFLGELAFHAPRFGWIEPWPFDPLRLALDTIVLMVAIVGGRIIPAFTRNTLRELGRAGNVTSRLWLDAPAIAAVAAVLVGDLVAPASRTAGVLAGVAAVLLGARALGWQGLRTRDVPLLWVLHVGYGWLVVGLALKAAWLLGGLGWAVNWMHAITAGTFGTMILGVTTRAALGHTGRPLTAAKPIAVAYLLVTLAAALRVFGPGLVPSRYTELLSVSIGAWLAAFTIYLVVYTPILLQPRLDGEPG